MTSTGIIKTYKEILLMYMTDAHYISNINGKLKIRHLEDFEAFTNKSSYTETGYTMRKSFIGINIYESFQVDSIVLLLKFF